jgi:hypothetical protein
MLRDRDFFAGKVPVLSGGILRRTTASKAGWELGENQRMLEAVERAPAAALQRKGKRLSAAEQVALRVVAEGRTIDERIAFHQAEIRKGGRPARERAALVTMVGLLRKARRYVDEPNGVPILSAKAKPRLHEALELVRRNADRREEILSELSRLSPAEIEGRIQAPGRVIGGARWETGRGRASVQRRLERTEAEAARQGRVVEGMREQYRRSEERTRPLTLAEAETRIADVERRFAKLVEAKAASMMPGNLRQEVNRRTRKNRKLRNRGRPELPTIKQEVRAAAERQVILMLEESEHPAARRFLAELEEASRLRRGLREIRGEANPLLPEEAIPAQRASARVRRELLGTTKADRDVGLEAILRHEERRERKVQKRADSAREALAAEPGEGLIGAEDFAGGQTRIPYERGFPGLSPAAFVRGVRGSYGGLSRGRALGYPRELPTTRKPFTGEALRSGYFKTGTTELVGADLERAQRFAAVLRARDALLAAAKDVPDDPLTAIAIRVDDLRDRNLSRALRESIEAAESKELTKRHLRELERDRGIETLRREAFPDMSWEDYMHRLDAGDPDVQNVKWVDADLLEQSGLNAPPSLLASATRKAKGARAVLTVADLINDASRVAILYLKPAYLAPNLLGNLAMNVVQQGVFAPVNLAKSARLAARLGDEGTAIVDSVMGEGFTAALRGEGQVAQAVANRLANVWGKAVDVPFRRAAFLHEARRAGYRKLADVRRLLEDESLRGELVQIARRANREIIDYSRLSPIERSVVRRVVFFYPWVKGATLYGARFPFEHPILSAALTQIGREGAERAKADLGAVPGFARGSFKVGERDGLPLVINPTSISVLSTPLEVATSVASFVRGEPSPGRELVESLSPVAGAAVTSLTGYDTFARREVDPGLGTFASELTEGLPQVRLAQRLGMNEADREGKLYPDTDADAVAQFLAGGAAPRPYNPEVAKMILRDDERAAMSSAERRAADSEARIAWARNIFKRAGEDFPSDYAGLVRRRALYDEAIDAIKVETGADNLTIAQRTAALIAVVRTVPNLRSYHDDYVALWKRSLGDPLDSVDPPHGRMASLYNAIHNVLYSQLEGYDRVVRALRDQELVGAS